MKNIKFIILFLVLSCAFSLRAQDISQLTAQCAANAGDVMYLKDFVVKLDAGTPGGAPPTARFALLLSKSVVYRFSICTAPNSEGEAVLQLFDMNTLLGSTFITATGKDFPFFDFKCQKTGVYHVFISFKEGKAGEGVGVLSYVKKL
ncbi:MAG: hypothetical protein JXR41_14530 [Bacteroidales bacterium]|nr:hypothetical protein [Bacteroidales bacterium]MBN2764307.1 hypothetical protein [Bacteroidales bacterium]